MNTNTAGSATVLNLLTPADAANTAAATGTAVDIRDYEGALIITQQVGVVTAGSITGKIQHGAAADGSDAADVPWAAFTAVTTSNDPLTQVISVNIDGLGRYIRYLGTIATGPAVVGVSAVGVKKNIG
jgi:hypothetical protein